MVEGEDLERLGVAFAWKLGKGLDNPERFGSAAFGGNARTGVAGVLNQNRVGGGELMHWSILVLLGEWRRACDALTQ